MHGLLQGSLLLAALASLLVSPASAGRSLQHVGRSMQNYDLRHERQKRALFDAYQEELEARATTTHKFLTSKTKKYAVNGTGIPDVDFDIGESYAGTLPISSSANSTGDYYWWFFPSTNEEADKEIIIWLNGGPGCSSLEGLIQENGPFLWQYGTFKPVANNYAWSKLSNIVYVEQPVGTGFSTGTVTITSEDDLAAAFLGFWKNFVDTFALQGYKVYITGESYAGMYCPYIANAMIEAKDTTYFNVSGMLIYDPVIGDDDIQGGIPAVTFVDYWPGLFPFNDSFNEYIHKVDKSCGYRDYLNKYLVYPPAGQQPVALPGYDKDGDPIDECENLYYDIAYAALDVNPCWDIYQVATTCPLLWDVLGFPGTLEYLPDGAEIYFDRKDVKKAINAPLNVTWSSCSLGNVFAGDGSDSSAPSGLTVLPNVIDATQNVIIGHGALDYVLLANGTLLAIQNMTWGGKLGFQSKPTSPLYIPAHDDPSYGDLAATGVMGTVHSERGLTYVGVALSGHMVPQYQPSVAYRNMELLLGRISSLSSVEAFTTDANVTQPVDLELGNGNAPQGWADQAVVTSNSSSSSSNGSTTCGSTSSSSSYSSPATVRVSGGLRSMDTPRVGFLAAALGLAGLLAL